MSAGVGFDEVHRLSLDEYHKLIEAGGFDEDARVELIDGVVVPRPYHPATAALVIELSASSLRRDLVTKSALYAAAGVGE